MADVFFGILFGLFLSMIFALVMVFVSHVDSDGTHPRVKAAPEVVAPEDVAASVEAEGIRKVLCCDGVWIVTCTRHVVEGSFGNEDDATDAMHQHWGDHLAEVNA